MKLQVVVLSDILDTSLTQIHPISRIMGTLNSLPFNQADIHSAQNWIVWDDFV